MTRTALYRHWSGAELVYVGISKNPYARLATHAQSSRWFDRVDRVTIEWLPTREAALEAEREAIANECPAFNVDHSPAQLNALAVLGVPAPGDARVISDIQHDLFAGRRRPREWGRLVADGAIHAWKIPGDPRWRTLEECYLAFEMGEPCAHQTSTSEKEAA